MNKKSVVVSVVAAACAARCWWFAARKPAQSGESAPAQAEEATIKYRQVDKALPRERQAATANRLFVAPEDGCMVETSFASTQTPSSRGTAPYVVIPEEMMGDVKIARLEEIGAPTLGFFPPNGILTELTPEQFAALKTDANGISLVGEWRAEDKISPYVTCDGAKTEIVVSTFNPSDLLRVAEIVRSLGGSVQSQGDNIHGWMRIDLPSGRDKVVTLASHGEIHWIEQHTQPTVANYNSVQTADLNVTPVWGGTTLNLTGKGQKVVVCDTGLDTGDASTVLSDFRGRIIDMVDIGGYGTCVDGGGHGTHVAGSLFGNGATSSNAKYKGVAYEAEAVIFACGTGIAGDDTMNFKNSGYYNLFARDIDTYGFRIFNASWGDSHTGAYGYWSQAADSDVANHPYLLITAASGNNNYSGDEKVCLLGTSKNALTVGAMVGNIAYSGNEWAGKVWPRSLYGTVDGRFKPDLIAPGVGIISTKSTRSALSDATDSNDTTISGYADMDGTSMATPLASGCATLLRQWLVEQRGMSEPSSALMKAILTGGANGSQPTEDAGWGCIDLKNSIAPDGAEVFLYDYITNTSDNAKLVAAFTITNTSTFKAQLAWIDPMATFGANPTLVMDHDLVVSNATTGAILKGNDFSNSGSYDTLNNVEGVRVTSPTVGHQYYVYLRGRTDQSGKLTVPAIYISAGAEPIEIEPEEPVEPGETDYLAHCYTFDSGMTGTGLADDCFKGEASSTTYTQTVETAGNGNAMVTQENADDNSLALHPYGTLTNSSAITVSLSLRSVATTNAALFCLGNSRASGMALVAASSNTVNLVRYASGSRTETIALGVQNAIAQYHHYALSYTESDCAVYVDGVKATTVTISQTDRNFQLGGIHGGSESTGIVRVSGVAIDDFRVYSKALTADEISALAAEFTPWPTMPKPVSDLSVLSFGYYFTGNESADWTTIGNWSRNAEYTNSVSELVLTSGNVPATSGSEVWDPLMFDGNLMSNLAADSDGIKHVSSPDSTSSGEQIEGYQLQMLLTNSVFVTIGRINKLQGGQTGMTVVVDDTSRLIVDAFNNANGNGAHNYYIFSPSGILFNAALDPSAVNSAYNYHLGIKGSAQYAALGTSRTVTHSVQSLTLDLGDTNLTGKAVVSRKLIGFTSQGSHAFNATSVTVASSVASISPASVSSVSDSNDIGTYCFSVKDDGYYVDYVAYAAQQTIELNINLEGEAESKVTANAEAVATLLAKEGVTSENINTIASNGLRVWQNAMLGLTPPDTTTEEITLSIAIENGSPVVTATTTGLSELGLSTSDPQKTITCGNVKATVTLQQAATPSPESWSTADTTSATTRFYRISVAFTAE